MNDWQIIQGDALEVLRTLEEESVDSVVTDPPYELGFMGKDWDQAGVSFRIETWAAVIRVLKPGAHLLAFGGTRTYHRLACAIEDAGFEIRDSIQWIYGTGFPKSLDVSKAIDEKAFKDWLEVNLAEKTKYLEQMRQAKGDSKAVEHVKRKFRKAAGAEREDFGPHPYPNATGWITAPASEGRARITAPATEAAKQWEGFGTALKPAHEAIVVARKPLEGTVAENVQKWGTAGINVDGCRMPSEGGRERHGEESQDRRYGDRGGTNFAATPGPRGGGPNGRWPPNVCLDEAAAEEMDRQSGSVGGGFGISGGDPNGHGIYNKAFPRGDRRVVGFGDSGGASRFFPIFRYEPKASRSERDAGLPDYERCLHPTVKPVALMQWLCRLVTPKGGLILDLFVGSGSTGIAAVREGFRFIGIELNPEYVQMATRRIEQDAPLFNKQML